MDPCHFFVFVLVVIVVSFVSCPVFSSFPDADPEAEGRGQ